MEKNDGEIIRSEIPVTSTRLGSLVAGAMAEETFLNVLNRFQIEEHGGRLPIGYSNLSLGELRQVIGGDTPRLSEKSDDKSLETYKVKETLSLINNHSGQIAIVKNEKDILNPVGEINPARLLIMSDLHFPASYAVEGSVEYAFRGGYGLERRLKKAMDAKIQKGKFPLEPLGTEEGIPENLLRKYIMWQDNLTLFYDWFGDVVHMGDQTQVLVSLGDLVNDGAFLIDQLDENSRLISMMSNSQKEAKLLWLNGNHDQPYYAPESLVMLTLLFGHRVFAQEVGGVLFCGIDTNLFNRVWVKEINRRGDDDAKRLLSERQKFQDIVLDKMRSYDGPVLLAGHSPTHLIKSLADFLPETKVQRIISGHIHKNASLRLPIRNRDGEQITLDVLNSSTHYDEGEPKPQDLFQITLEDGRISPTEILHEPQELFSRRYNALVDLR